MPQNRFCPIWSFGPWRGCPWLNHEFDPLFPVYAYRVPYIWLFVKTLINSKYLGTTLPPARNKGGLALIYKNIAINRSLRLLGRNVNMTLGDIRGHVGVDELNQLKCYWRKNGQEITPFAWRSLTHKILLKAWKTLNQKGVSLWARSPSKNLQKP